jgi:hypothetical protein
MFTLTSRSGDAEHFKTRTESAKAFEVTGQLDNLVALLAQGLWRVTVPGARHDWTRSDPQYASLRGARIVLSDDLRLFIPYPAAEHWKSLIKVDWGRV